MRVSFLRWIAPLILSLLASGPVLGQPAPTALGGQDQPVRISIQPLYQEFSAGDVSVRQRSLRLSISAPITDRLGLFAVGQAASASGDDLAAVDGLDDPRVGLQYTRRIGEASVQLATTAGVPVGTDQLRPDAFDTAAELGEDLFAFQVPSFGQGFSVSPRLSLALSLGETVVLGLGGSYQYQSGYKPVTNMTGQYTPGNAWTATGGLDIRLSPTTALSGDVSYTRYGTDTVGGRNRFEAGDRLAATLQFLNRFEYNQLRIVAQVRDRDPSRLYPRSSPFPETAQVLPRQALVRLALRPRLAEWFYLGLRVDGRHYRQTDRYDKRNAGTFSVRPEVRLSDAVRITARAAYTFIDVEGLEGGLGLNLLL